MECDTRVNRFMTAMMIIEKCTNNIFAQKGVLKGEFMLLAAISLSNSDSECCDNVGVKNSELSELMMISKPAISNILHNLEKKGYIIRDISKNDRREVSIFLTEKGRDYLENSKMEMEKGVAVTLEKFGDSESDVLIDYLEKYAEIVKEG